MGKVKDNKEWLDGCLDFMGKYVYDVFGCMDLDYLVDKNGNKLDSDFDLTKEQLENIAEKVRNNEYIANLFCMIDGEVTDLILEELKKDGIREDQ